MRKILRGIFAFVFFILCSFFFTHVSFAADKITSSVEMQYNVLESGITHVAATITLTNTTDNYYVTSYTVDVGFPSISNVSASDPIGPVQPVIKPVSLGQEIKLPLNDIVAGKGKSVVLLLSFDTPDVASRNGSIWEVNIPGLANQTQFKDFTVDVQIPPVFGNPTFVKPATPNNSLHFTKDMLNSSGISLAFGKSQTYNYQLTYRIQNPGAYPTTTSIALPMTTNYQNVSLQSLSPKPENVVIDPDGNWLAQYNLQPAQQISITAAGLITVSLTPKKEVLDNSLRKTYLQQQQYWQVNDAAIQTLAHSLQTPEAIYQYVVNHLTYDFNRIQSDQVRIGALGVLQHPQSAVCLEFTDLFIALARAAGIPAREVDGFAYTQNTISRPLLASKDVLHAWPEYYDDGQKTWVMVDPTWGNTTGGVDYFQQLDFDHVAFVVRGVSSTSPIPAGGYKLPATENEKDVAVNVSQETITDQPILSMSFRMPENIMSGLPISGSVQLSNAGAVLFPTEPMQVVAKLLTPHLQFVDSPQIPPYGRVTKAISFNRTPFLTNLRDTITITLSGKSVTAHVSIVPVTKQFLLIGGIIIVVSIALIWLIATRPWRL